MCHPQTDCFIVSQPISVARHATCFQLGLKPACFYANWISYRRGTRKLSVSDGVLMRARERERDRDRERQRERARGGERKKNIIRFAFLFIGCLPFAIVNC